MSGKEILTDLDYRRFFQLSAERQAAIEQAPATPPKALYPVNLLARELHPELQHLLISEIAEHGADAKTFTLVPNAKKGTEKLAYFKAGQHLSVFLNINGSTITRPYSLCSRPKDAFEGKYMLTIKRAPDGFASDYILKNWKVGDEITATEPSGTFRYEPLRDARTVIGIAGGSGFTPFYSLASAIADGTEDAELILLYGSRTRDSIIFKEEFDKIAAVTPKFKVIHVLSHEEAEGYEHGFISAEIIAKYAPDGDYSIFTCGPQQMYTFIDKEAEKLGLETRRVRHDNYGDFHNPDSQPDYPMEAKGKTFEATVRIRDEVRVISCRAEESLLVAMERAGLHAPAHCRSGECGFCHSRLVSGNVYIPEYVDYRRLADYDFGYVHPCCTFPISDVTIEVATTG